MASKEIRVQLVKDVDFVEYVKLASAPSGNTPTGKARLYFKTDDILYKKIGGTETAIAGGGGATTALDNLAAVAINAGLDPDADGTLNMGTSSLRWSTLYSTQVNSGVGPLTLTNEGTAAPQDIYLSTNGGATMDTNVASGVIALNTSNCTGTGSSGNITFTTGNVDASGTAGSINFNGGTGGAAGAVQFSGFAYINAQAEIRNVASPASDFATEVSYALNNEGAFFRCGVWKRYVVDATYFTAAATTESKILFTLANGQYLESVVMKTATAYSGGTASAYTLSVGISGNVDKYASAYDVFAAAANTNFQSSIVGSPESWGTTQVDVTAVCTGDNVANVNTGAVEIWCKVASINDLPIDATLS